MPRNDLRRLQESPQDSAGDMTSGALGPSSLLASPVSSIHISSASEMVRNQEDGCPTNTMFTHDNLSDDTWMFSSPLMTIGHSSGSIDPATSAPTRISDICLLRIYRTPPYELSWQEGPPCPRFHSDEASKSATSLPAACVATACKAFSQDISDLTVPLHIRIVYALEWLERAKPVLPTQAVVTAYQMTVGLLWDIETSAEYFGVTSSAHLGALQRCLGLAADGAIYALSVSKVKAAIGMVEHSRAVFWQRGLHLRMSFTDTEMPKELCARLPILAAQLHREDDPLRRIRLSREFQELVARVRAMPGHEWFLRPPPLFIIRGVAARGAAILLIPGRDYSEVVILREETDTPERLKLQITSGELEAWQRRFRVIHEEDRARIVSEASLDSERHVIIKERQRWMKRQSPHIEFFAQLWERIGSPIIRHLNLQRSNGRARPRVWLCPVGGFVFMPLHAAGIYSGQLDAGECMSDYAVWSYTQTWGALAVHYALGYDRREQSSVLLVSAAHAKDMPPLPNATREVEQVRKLVPPHLLHQHPPHDGHGGSRSDDSRWTVRDVLERLPHTGVLHLACHGQQHPHNPLQSGFFIGEEKLTIEDLLNSNIRTGRLAFLSACETAKGDGSQPDEVVHLASAMMFVGFPSVIATLWSMNDTDGPDVARIVYQEMFKDGVYDHDGAAYGLDAAVHALRDEGVPPSRWATYIHMGI